MYFILFLLPIVSYAYFFIKPFTPISRKLTIIQENENIELLKKINGFYGLIGPNIERTNTKSLLDLFTGNGIIQGVFLEDGTITFVKNEIKTDKRIIEECLQRNHKDKYKSILFRKKIPNMLGVANTAFFHFKNITYTLFERDFPYIIDIDFTEKKINTVGKQTLEDISHFSAHSKIRYNQDHSYIETIDYDILQKKVKVYQLDNYFRVLSSMQIPMKYIPIVHDFISTPESMVILNSPFMADLQLFPSFSTKIKLDVTKTSIFYVITRNNNKIRRYYVNQAIFIFHYADVYETENEIEMYAPVHDTLDFSNLDVKGKYRKITLNKRTFQVKIERNAELEFFNLEFPIPFFHENKKKVVLRYVDNEKDRNTGFVICYKLEIEKHIPLPNRCICGEPSIIRIQDAPFLLFFAVDRQDNGFFIVLNIETEKMIEIPIYEKMNIGFHSIFLPNKII